jgi:hypothetical protein
MSISLLRLSAAPAPNLFHCMRIGLSVVRLRRAHGAATKRNGDHATRNTGNAAVGTYGYGARSSSR